jgi:hypothetical protein
MKRYVNSPNGKKVFSACRVPLPVDNVADGFPCTINTVHSSVMYSSGELWHSGPCSSGSEAGEDKGQNHVAAAAFGDYDVRVRASWSQTGAASFGTSRRVGHGHAAVPRSLSLTWRPISSAHVFFRDQYGPHQEIPLTIDLCATLSGDIISNSTFSSVNLDVCSDQC